MSTAQDQPVTIAIIGTGERGKGYGNYALLNPSLCKVAAIAEPRPRTRSIVVAASLLPSQVFANWQDLLAASATSLQKSGKRLADAIVICVHDKMHVEVVEAFAQHGYDILCEKPLATSPEECIRIAEAVKKGGKIFAVGHVLRYSPYNQALVEVIRSGRLGQPVNIVHVEPVGYFHFAHSYVRGNWSREQQSSFSLMTKSSHDIDIVGQYLSPATPKRVSSFGSLTHFKKAAKPAEAGSAMRCLQCPYERQCPYSAKKIYLEPVQAGSLGWPAAVLTDGPPDIESVTTALETGPYGRCVYESDNDVVDHQVVNLEYSDGSTCSVTMVAFTERICERQTRIHFTHGEIVGDMISFTVMDFRTGEKTTVTPPTDDYSGHGGGDMGLMSSFIRAVKEQNQELLHTTVDEVLESHLTVFAAEKSRKEGTVVDVKEFELQIRKGMGLLK